MLKLSQSQDEHAAASFADGSALRGRIRFLHQCVADLTAVNRGGLTSDQALDLHDTNRALQRNLEDARSGMDRPVFHGSCSLPNSTEMARSDDRRRQAEEALAAIRIEMEQNSNLEQIAVKMRSDDVDEQFQIQILSWTKRLKELKLSKMQLEVGDFLVGLWPLLTVSSIKF